MEECFDAPANIIENLDQGQHESLRLAEQDAVEMLKTELSKHLALTMKAFNLIGMAVDSLPEGPVLDVSQSRNTATTLLIRLSNDLRSAVLLAVRGYTLQASTLVASMYETAYTIAAIGPDDSFGDKWINHIDPTKAFGNVLELTRQGLTKLHHPDVEAQAKIEYRIYRQLCLAKHVNPLLQKQQGYRLEGTNIVAGNGPDLSEEAVRIGWFALEHAAGLSFVALLSFISNHSPDEKKADLLRQAEVIGADRKVLEGLAISRWGTDDPFPGKW